MRLRPVGASLPCAFPRRSERLGRVLILRPAVDCPARCGDCPWNPTEQRRRLAEGSWRRGADGLLRLHFRPGKKNDSGEDAREQEELS